MRLEVNGKSIRVLAPAKLNLFLEVCRKLPNGYHAIDSLMCPIDLTDCLTVTPIASPEVQLQVSFSDSAHKKDVAWDIPHDGSNLVVRAVERVRQLCHVESGCRILLNKSIPAAAGLAGGSSDAAAAIVASLAVWDKWDRELAEKIARELGSDIKFFLGDEEHGVGLARARGSGEVLDVLASQPEMNFAISHPAEGCSTAKVYSLAQVPDDPKSIDAMLTACNASDVGQIGKELYNALEKPAAELTSWIPQQLDCFRAAGARHAGMTGSGSACFAIASTFSAAQEFATYMKQAGLPRAYASKTWYARSIESQLHSILGSI